MAQYGRLDKHSNLVALVASLALKEFIIFTIYYIIIELQNLIRFLIRNRPISQISTRPRAGWARLLYRFPHPSHPRLTHCLLALARLSVSVVVEEGSGKMSTLDEQGAFHERVLCPRSPASCNLLAGPTQP
jgi:hypothetical protein